MSTLHHRWNDLPTDHPLERIARQRVVANQAMLSRVVLDEGAVVPLHAHDNEQLVVVLSGCLRFELGDPEASDVETVTVGADEVLVLPSNLLHSAVAQERSVVLDVFSPPSATTGIDRD